MPLHSYTSYHDSLSCDGKTPGHQTKGKPPGMSNKGSVSTPPLPTGLLGFPWFRHSLLCFLRESPLSRLGIWPFWVCLNSVGWSSKEMRIKNENKNSFSSTGTSSTFSPLSKKEREKEKGEKERKITVVEVSPMRKKSRTSIRII